MDGSCRDGCGTMISTDFYEGIRQAQSTDVDAIEALLKPLTSAGITKARSRESLMRDVSCFTVLEREQEVSHPINTSPCRKLERNFDSLQTQTTCSLALSLQLQSSTENLLEPSYWCCRKCQDVVFMCLTVPSARQLDMQLI